MRRTRIGATVVVLAVLASLTLTSVPASAATDCSFTTVGSTMYLDGDCTTDSTILVPDGFTLNGGGHTITAVDPAAGHFVGAIVANAGVTAHVTHLTVTASGLANVCDGGADRLRGIMFESASGSITHSSVTGINQGASGCQEGNGIEIRNAPFDGSHPGTETVEVAHNLIVDFQKTGLVANGDVDASIHHNRFSASATQANLAANTIQFGFGALGSAVSNTLEGNQWLGWSPASDYAASGILVYLAGDVYVAKNHITGNSDVGIFLVSFGGLYEKNHVFDRGKDASGYDVGIWDWYDDATFNKNKVKGFDTPFIPDPLTGEKNKALPSN